MKMKIEIDYETRLCGLLSGLIREAIDAKDPTIVILDMANQIAFKHDKLEYINKELLEATNDLMASLNAIKKHHPDVIIWRDEIRMEKAQIAISKALG